MNMPFTNATNQIVTTYYKRCNVDSRDNSKFVLHFDYQNYTANNGAIVLKALQEVPLFL